MTACICNSPDGHHDLYCWAARFATDPWTDPPNRPIPTSGPTPGSDYARRLDAVNELAREVEPPEPTDDSALFERRHKDRVGDVFGRSA